MCNIYEIDLLVAFCWLAENRCLGGAQAADFRPLPTAASADPTKGPLPAAERRLAGCADVHSVARISGIPRCGPSSESTIPVMPEVMVTVPPQVAKRCPACGNVSVASNRCLHCWRDIAGVMPLPSEEAESALKAEGEPRPGRATRWLTVGRVWRYGSLAVVALLVGWWAYATFIDTPPRPEAPSSTARSAAPGFWATRDGDNSGTRLTTASAHLGGVEAWRATLGSPAATALVTDGDLLVAPLQDGRMIGLEASSGKTRWTAMLSNPPLSAPVIAGDRIYIVLRQGLLLVLNARNGTEAWRAPFDAGGSVEASPLVANGVVYTYSSDGVFAFDAEDGRALWEYLFDVRSAIVTPVIEGKHLVIVTINKAIVFDRTTGEQTYYVTFSRTPPSSIAIRDGKVLVVYGRNVTAFAATSRRPWWDGLANISIGGGTVRGAWFRFHLYGMAPAVPPQVTLWGVSVPSRRTVPAAVGQGVVVVASPDGAVTALSERDGTQVWTAKTGLLVTAPVITADGVLFVGENRLVLLDAVTGQQRAERKIDGIRGATPVGAATFVGTNAGDVIALR